MNILYKVSFVFIRRKQRWRVEPEHFHILVNGGFILAKLKLLQKDNSIFFFLFFFFFFFLNEYVSFSNSSWEFMKSFPTFPS